MLAFLFLGSVLVSTLAYPFPDAPVANGGFSPIPQARGIPPSQKFSRPAEKPKFSPSASQPVVDNAQAGSNTAPVYGGPGGEPTQTFYVNVPQEQYPVPHPIAAGPPRKHYRIVLIRAPSPPPPQPILPPRFEQKTLIYVLHPRPQLNQEVLEVPNVKHDPQVYFIQYDDEPPTQEDLQELVKNTIDGHGSNVNFGAAGNSYAGSAPADVFAPGPQAAFGGGDGYHSGNGISARQAPKFEASQTPQSFQQSKPLATSNRAQQQSKDSQVSPQPQQAKYIRTRSTSAEAGTSDKKIPSFVAREAPASSSSNFAKSKFTVSPVEPSDELKAAFGDSFGSNSPLNRPFRFGSKLKNRRSGTNAEESAKENKS